MSADKTPFNDWYNNITMRSLIELSEYGKMQLAWEAALKYLRSRKHPKTKPFKRSRQDDRTN